MEAVVTTFAKGLIFVQRSNSVTIRLLEKLEKKLIIILAKSPYIKNMLKKFGKKRGLY